MTTRFSDPKDATQTADATSAGGPDELDLLGDARSRLAAMAGMRRVLEELDRAIEAGQLDTAKALLAQVQRAVDAPNAAEPKASVPIGEIRYTSPEEGSGSDSTSKSR
jgi:hypothetical protein